ncbi:MAG: hypothetical protein U9R25_03865 [Chloroflexota bacterium]|nr:hypothetical protein [Chloroflexota bacterium]
MSPINRYASLLVRFWSEDEAKSNDSDAWCGEIEHIQSGQRWTFGSLEEMRQFLTDCLDDPDRMLPSSS